MSESGLLCLTRFLVPPMFLQIESILFEAGLNSIMHTNYNFFRESSVDGHLGSLPNLDIVNSSLINMGAYREETGSLGKELA